MNAAIVVAAGGNPSMGAHVDRAFLSLGTRPVLAYSLMAFEKCPDIDIVVVVVRKDRVEAGRGVAQMFGCSKVAGVVAGAARRLGSVLAGLKELSSDVTIVTVHDASRPCVTPELISQTIKAAKRYGSGVAAAKCEDSVKLVEKGQQVSKSLERTKLWLAQTPQSFKIELLREGLEAARKAGGTITDDAEAVELVSKDVRLVPTSARSVKITTADDLTLAAGVMRL